MKTKLLKTTTLLFLLMANQLFSQITISETHNNLTCNGDNSGSIDITPSGGDPPYNYEWEGPNSFSANVEDISNLEAGDYTVTVYDQASNSDVLTITVTEPSALVVIPEVTDATCNASCDGSIYLNTSGGVTPYTYYWASGDNLQNLDNLCAGTYLVTVTDANGCESAQTITVVEPDSISIIVSKYDNSCFHSCDGSINLTITGGVGNYSYNWNTGAQTENINNLCLGNYSVSVTDENNCTSTKTITITEPSDINITSSKYDVSCNGSCNGSIDLTVSGGVGNYVYNWSNGEVTEDINGLCAGIYYVSAQDENGCIRVDSVMINEPSEITITNTKNDVSCYGSCNGDIDLTVSGGSGNYYVYNWSNGEVTEDINGLCAGSYIVSVQDENSCISVDTIIINEPSEIIISLDSSANSTNGLCNGNIYVSATGGVPSYMYNWDNYETNNYILNLCPGDYTVSVTDVNGCIKEATFSISSVFTNPVNANDTNYVDTISTVIDTCIFNNSMPIDSAFIYNHTNIGTDSVELNWVFWQNNTAIYFDMVTSVQNQGNNLIHLTLSCNNKSTNVYQFFGSFNTVTTSNQEINVVSEINIYPNPTSGIISIDGENIENIEIYNAKGQIILSGKKTIIDLSLYRKGMYFVKITTNNSLIVKKIILE